MLELIEQAKEDILLLPNIVQVWMRWLNIIFLLGIVFIKNHLVARWALAAYIACFPLAVPIYYFTRDINLLGVPHLLFWAPLLIYILKKELNNSQFNLKSSYSIWVLLLSLTILISLVFDIKEIYFVIAR